MTSKLQVQSVFGFGGNVRNGLIYHPNRKYIIYPIGSQVVVKSLVDPNDIHFLTGHDGSVSCIQVSKCGKFVASGQSTHMGFKASIIVWNFQTLEILHKFVLHKVKVECLSFSHNSKHLVSCGGVDDNNIIVWSLETGKAVCGKISPHSGINCVTFFNKTNEYIVVGLKYRIVVWKIDYKNLKLVSFAVNLGRYKRDIKCFILDTSDKYLYCGTTSGDVLCVQVSGPARNFKYSGPRKKLQRGIHCIAFTIKGNIVVGSGNGSVYVLGHDDLHLMKKIDLATLGMKKKSKKKKKSGKKLTKEMAITEEITSITGGAGVFYVGTSFSNIFHLNKKYQPLLISTCHSTRINDIAFPSGTSEIIATCSAKGDIRLWSTKKHCELVRIEIPNLECNCISFSHNGNLIVSGWSDGKIRGYGPESGKLLFEINEAHKVVTLQKKKSGTIFGVTAIAMTHCDGFVISGGVDGQLRIWKITPTHQVLKVNLKQHKSSINQIYVKSDDTQCVTASDDGSCIVWDLQKYVRSNIMYQTTYFKAVCLLNDESQIITAGSNKLITFWDFWNCKTIRELEVSGSEVNCLDIAPNGNAFVCGGNDNILMLWDYDDGELVAKGFGHSGSIMKAKFSPDNKLICSVDKSGGIICWENIVIEDKEIEGEG